MQRKVPTECFCLAMLKSILNIKVVESPEKEKVPLKPKRSLKVDEDFVMPDVDDDDEDWVEEDTSAVDEKVALAFSLNIHLLTVVLCTGFL